MDAALELGTIPENRLSIALGDNDERVLGFFDLGFWCGIDGGILAVAATLGAVEDVAFGDLVETLAHQFLLNHVLYVLDVNESTVTKAHTLRHSTGNCNGAFRILFHREESLAAGLFDLGWHPWNHGAISADEPDGEGGGLRIGVGIQG